ncbi:NSUN2, partial [Symbiodinium pilosum]
ADVGGIGIRSSGKLPVELSQKLPEALAERIGMPTLNRGFLLSRGARKLFYCSPGLDLVLRARRSKPLSLVSAGTGVASAASDVWQLTPSGVEIFGQMSGRKAEANAQAARKHLESH